MRDFCTVRTHSLIPCQGALSTLGVRPASRMGRVAAQWSHDQYLFDPFLAALPMRHPRGYLTRQQAPQRDIFSYPRAFTHSASSPVLMEHGLTSRS